MIEIKDLHKSYQMGKNSLHVLKGIDFSVKEGELVSIMGASGSGKSTLLNILGILDSYDAGEYRLNGSLIRDLSETDAAKYRNEMIGFVFQSFNLINFKNALENVALPLYYKKVSRKKRNAIAMEHLDRMGLKDWAHHMPNELSGGQKQRVAIARAMISNPKIILADEPTGNLDTATGQHIIELLISMRKAQGRTLVLVTHDPALAARCDRVVRMRSGVLDPAVPEIMTA